MEIAVISRYGYGSGVTENLIGREIEQLLLSDDEKLLLIGELLSHIAQGHDVSVRFLPDSE